MNKRLYVGNLSYQTSEQTLEQLFAQVGQVVEAIVMQDRYDGRSRGFGFVEMATEQAAEAAVGRLNQAELDGRSIKVAEAKPRRSATPRRESYLRGPDSYRW